MNIFALICIIVSMAIAIANIFDHKLSAVWGWSSAIVWALGFLWFFMVFYG